MSLTLLYLTLLVISFIYWIFCWQNVYSQDCWTCWSLSVLACMGCKCLNICSYGKFLFLVLTLAISVFITFLFPGICLWQANWMVPLECLQIGKRCKNLATKSIRRRRYVHQFPLAFTLRSLSRKPRKPGIALKIILRSTTNPGIDQSLNRPCCGFYTRPGSSKIAVLFGWFRCYQALLNHEKIANMLNLGNKMRKHLAKNLRNWFSLLSFDVMIW